MSRHCVIVLLLANKLMMMMMMMTSIVAKRLDGWTKMPLGMEVGFGSGDFVFDGDPATPSKRAHPPHPIFGPCLLWPNSWMDEDATWCGGKRGPRRRCVRSGRSFPKRGTVPSFRFLSVVAKRVDG